MDDFDIVFLGLADIRNKLMKRELTAMQLVRAFLERIETMDPKIHAFLSYDRDIALVQAKRIDEIIENGQGGLYPLLGVPLVIFDRIPVEGLPWTMGSSLLKDQIAKEDAVEVRRLKLAGAIVLGKSNCSEFSFFYRTTNSLVGTCLNPWNVSAESGGGEGGAAAAVAACLASAAIVMDGSGSLRLPAGYCGVFGIKPTRNLVPIIRNYEVPFAQKAFSQVGPIVRSARDAALLLNILAHPQCTNIDCLIHGHEDYLNAFSSKGKLRIGWSDDLGFISANPESVGALHKLLHQLESRGHILSKAKLNLSNDVLMHMGNILFAETYLPIISIIKEHPEKYDLLAPETKMWLDRGKEVKGIALSMGLTYMDWLQSLINQYFTEADLLLTPVSPSIPEQSNSFLLDPLLGMWSYLLPFNMSGHPSAVTPCGKTKSGLPIGVQIIAPYFKEQLILGLADEIDDIFHLTYHQIAL